MALGDEVRLTESALEMIINLAVINRDHERWSVEQPSLARTTAANSRSIYEHRYAPALEQYRRIPQVAKLMATRELALKEVV